MLQFKVLFLMIPFQAIHWYIPAWLLLIPLITWTLSVTSTFPDFIQAVWGDGLPVPLQYNVTLSPSVTGLGQCCIKGCGGSAKTCSSIYYRVVLPQYYYSYQKRNCNKNPQIGLIKNSGKQKIFSISWFHICAGAWTSQWVMISSWIIQSIL